MREQERTIEHREGEGKEWSKCENKEAQSFGRVVVF